MLLLVSLWLLLGSSSLLIGHSMFLALGFDHHFPKIYDRVFISVWLGIALISPIFLSVSLIIALTPIVALFIYGSAIGLALAYKQNVTMVKAYIRKINSTYVVGTLLVAIGAAWCSSQIITHYDAGLYHVQSIKWLAEYGTVPGVALIHERLGFSSSWFALLAPMDHGLLQSKVYATLGGFTFFTMIHALGVNLSRIAVNQANREDIFLSVALMLATPPILFWRMAVSPSPDVPLILLTILISWIYLNIDRSPPKSGGIFDINILPLIIALSATTIKLSAIPLLIMTFIFYCISGPMKFNRFIFATLLASILLFPVLIVNAIITGYPLFPSSLLYLDLPWMLEVDFVKNLELTIRDWARWGGPAPEGKSSWDWFLPWVKRNILYFISMLLTPLILLVVAMENRKETCCNILKSIAVFYTYEKIILLAFFGMAFSFYSAPDLRFGLGYAVIMPAIVFAIFIGKVLQKITKFYKEYLLDMKSYGMLIVICFAIHIYYKQTPQYKEIILSIKKDHSEIANVNFNIWMPPKTLYYFLDFSEQDEAGYLIRELTHTNDHTGDFIYRRPTSEEAEHCWDAPLPCAPKKISNVRLRDPKVGFGGGFVRFEEN